MPGLVHPFRQSWYGFRPPCGTALAESGPGKGPAFYVPFDDLAGTQPRDAAGQGNVWTVNGGVTVGTPPAGGPAGQALKFDGSTGFLSCPVATGSALDMGSLLAFTLFAWVYPTATPQGSGVISQNYAPHNVQYEIGFGFDEGGGGSSKLKAGYSLSDGWTLAADGANIALNQWYFIAATFQVYTTTKISLYKNGILISQAVPGIALPAMSSPVRIGRRHDTGGTTPFFPGWIASAGLIGRALDSPEVMALYKGTFDLHAPRRARWPSGAPAAAPVGKIVQVNQSVTNAATF